MIEISAKQAETIHKLIINKEQTLGKYYGLSAAGLARYGMNRKTFENNKDSLLSNYLISHVATQHHGDQKWKYFDATPLGFLTLYQNFILGKIKRKKFSFRNLERFFPIIYRNWDSLSEICQKYPVGYEMYDFFASTLDGITIDNNYTTVYQNVYPFKPLTVRINLDFEFYSISLKSEFQFSTKDFSFPRRHGIVPSMDDRDLFMKNIRENFTFLFFFNMFQKRSSYEDDAMADQLISVIKNDEELKQIFNNKIKFTFKFVEDRPLVRFLAEKIPGKSQFVLRPS